MMIPRTLTVLATVCGCLTQLLTPPAAHADVVLDWNATTLSTLSTQSPFAAARFAAITQLAVFEAVNAITRDYDSYLGTIAAPADASPEAAAAAAAHGVLRAYFPGRSVELDAALVLSLAAIPDGPGKAAGVEVGVAAATAMLARRANDGSAVPQFYVPGPTDPGQWQRTPVCPAGGGAFLHWRNVAPFGVPAIEQFRLGPPPALNSGRYAKDFAEVKAVGAIDSVLRPQDRADVARLFGLGLTPAAWANSAARQIAAARGHSLSENARALALLNMALSDGTVAAFDTKYHYNFWRPETAIRAASLDDNEKTDENPAFEPFVFTPCFPGYPSAHASVSYAASEVLERLYGPSGHDISLSSPVVPGVTLHYTAFKRIVEDIDDARVFGGIHFRFDQEEGAHQGKSVGAYVYTHNLRPRNPR
jgi:hypothetical protein